MANKDLDDVKTLLRWVGMFLFLLFVVNIGTCYHIAIGG